MTDLEKDNNKIYIEIDEENNKKLDKEINDFFDDFKSTNKIVEDPDRWSLSDFYDINELERIKQTPEYIIEKIVNLFKNFINLKENFVSNSSNNNKHKYEINFNKQRNSEIFSHKHNTRSSFDNLPISESNSSNSIKEKKIEEKDEKRNKEIDNYKLSFFKKKIKFRRK